VSSLLVYVRMYLSGFEVSFYSQVHSKSGIANVAGLDYQQIA